MLEHAAACTIIILLFFIDVEILNSTFLDEACDIPNPPPMAWKGVVIIMEV